jgi:uncharacterized membrane protein
MAKELKKPRDESRSKHWVAGLLIVFGAVGLLASFVLSVDYIALLREPETVLSCDINSALSCAHVMRQPQAEVLFGIPNSFFGMLAFPVLITIGVVMAVGARFPKWFKVCLQLAAICGLAAAWWMFFDSLYIIGVLCPWCLSVTTSMTIIFGAITHYNLRENTFDFKRSTYDKILKLLNADIDKVIWASVLVIFASLAFAKFGSALFQ